MENKEIFNKYYRYYIMLEKDVLKLEKYIDFSNDNKKTFSIEIQKQILSVYSEIDVVCKELFDFDPKENIEFDTYAKRLIEDDPDIVNESLQSIYFTDFELTPFKDMIAIPDTRNPQRPFWNCWNSYNSLKHGRSGSFNQAKLGLLLDGIGALYILELKLLEKYGVRNRYDSQVSELFDPMENIIYEDELNEMLNEVLNDKLNKKAQ